MSEPINSGFPFPGMESSEELDISAIFGGSAPANDINPFDTPAKPAAAPVTQPEPAPATKPAPQAQTQSSIPASEPANPISAAIDKQETQTAQTAAKSLFEKPPIFSYCHPANKNSKRKRNKIAGEEEKRVPKRRDSR